jgi:hypothetical protein
MEVDTAMCYICVDCASSDHNMRHDHTPMLPSEVSDVTTTPNRDGRSSESDRIRSDRSHGAHQWTGTP